MFTGTLTLVSWLGLNLSATVHEVFPALAVSTLTYVLFGRRGSASAQLPNL
jgi:Na+/pantothenate symporter